MQLIEIFSTPLVKNFAIPFIGVLLGVGIRMFSRNDNIVQWHKREDYAVGFDMGLAAIIAFLINTFSMAGKTMQAQTPSERLDLFTGFFWSFLIFVVLCVVLVTISFIVRKFGFNRSVFPKEELTTVGILIPFVYGFLALVIAGIWAG